MTMVRVSAGEAFIDLLDNKQKSEGNREGVDSAQNYRASWCYVTMPQ